MTRYVIDALASVRLAREGLIAPAAHQLVAPNLLGDRVARATAWRIAEELDGDDTTAAEYVAVAKLQADAFVTLDGELAASVGHIVPIAAFEALLGSADRSESE